MIVNPPTRRAHGKFRTILRECLTGIVVCAVALSVCSLHRYAEQLFGIFPRDPDDVFLCHPF